MMVVFYFGIGASLFVTGFAASPWQIAVGLTVTGMFAAIYHPVGIAMLVAAPKNLGMALGWNGLWGQTSASPSPQSSPVRSWTRSAGARRFSCPASWRWPPASPSCCWCPIRARCRRSRSPSACIWTRAPDADLRHPARRHRVRRRHLQRHDCGDAEGVRRTAALAYRDQRRYRGAGRAVYSIAAFAHVLMGTLMSRYDMSR